MIRFLGVASVVLGIAASVVPNDAGAVNVILNGGFEGACIRMAAIRACLTDGHHRQGSMRFLSSIRS